MNWKSSCRRTTATRVHCCGRGFNKIKTECSHMFMTKKLFYLLSFMVNHFLMKSTESTDFGINVWLSKCSYSLASTQILFKEVLRPHFVFRVRSVAGAVSGVYNTRDTRLVSRKATDRMTRPLVV